jgi:hypothetical protein
MSLQVYSTDWIAGIYEGEGSFFVSHRDKPWHKRIAVGMCNREVIYHLRRLTGVGVLTAFNPSNPNWNIKYSWNVNKRRDIESVVGILYPYMCTRRRDTVHRLVQEPDNSVPRPVVTLDYLAGYLEGEGYFGYKYTSRITAMSKDLDVLKRISEYVGSGKVTPYNRYTKDKREDRNSDNWSAIYHWSIGGHTCRNLMLELYPRMSAYRQHQIKYALTKDRKCDTLPI